MKMMKGLIQIPFLLIIVASVIIVSAGVSLYFYERERNLATISEAFKEEVECPECIKCPEDSECPICEPEEIIKEIPVEKIVEIPVEKIVYQQIPQECPSYSEDTIVSPETPKSTAIILQFLNNREFSLKNISSETIILHHLKFYSPLALGDISLYIKFPDSVDSAMEYKLGGLLQFYNHKAEIFIDCKRNYDGILSSENCKRKQLEVALNEIRNKETAVLRIALEENSKSEVIIPSGEHRLEYVPGSITGASTTEDIIFSDFSF